MDTPDQPNQGPSRQNPTFALTIRPDRQPYCPLCGIALQPQVTRIRTGVAACKPCTYKHVMDYLFALLVYGTGLLDESWTQVDGIRFWVPDRLEPYSIFHALKELKPPVQPVDLEHRPVICIPCDPTANYDHDAGGTGSRNPFCGPYAPERNYG